MMQKRGSGIFPARYKRLTTVFTLGLIVFLTDHPQLTAASLFEISNSDTKENIKKYRLPSSASPQMVRYDCSKPQEVLEVSTNLETIRIEAINCHQKIDFKNLKQNLKLHTFPTKNQTFSSEFAYLEKGPNQFQLKADEQTVSVNILRFD